MLVYMCYTQRCERARQYNRDVTIFLRNRSYENLMAFADVIRMRLSKIVRNVTRKNRIPGLSYWNFLRLPALPEITARRGNYQQHECCRFRHGAICCGTRTAADGLTEVGAPDLVI